MRRFVATMLRYYSAIRHYLREMQPYRATIPCCSVAFDHYQQTSWLNSQTPPHKFAYYHRMSLTLPQKSPAMQQYMATLVRCSLTRVRCSPALVHCFMLLVYSFATLVQYLMTCKPKSRTFCRMSVTYRPKLSSNDTKSVSNRSLLASNDALLRCYGALFASNGVL